MFYYLYQSNVVKKSKVFYYLGEKKKRITTDVLKHMC